MEKKKLEEPCLTKMPLIVTKVICRWSLNDFLPRKILHFATSARQGISLLNLSGLRVEISRFHKEELRWGNLWPNFRARSLNLSNTTLSFSLLEHWLFMTVYAVLRKKSNFLIWVFVRFLFTIQLSRNKEQFCYLWSSWNEVRVRQVEQEKEYRQTFSCMHFR